MYRTTPRYQSLNKHTQMAKSRNHSKTVATNMEHNSHQYHLTQTIFTIFRTLDATLSSKMTPPHEYHQRFHYIQKYILWMILSFTSKSIEAIINTSSRIMGSRRFLEECKRRYHLRKSHENPRKYSAGNICINSQFAQTQLGKYKNYNKSNI